MEPEIIREPIAKELLAKHAEFYGDMVKVVVDVERGILALGGEWHADGEALLIADGSRQADLWGANVYNNQSGEARVVFTSLINIRPSAGNRDMDIQNQDLRVKVRKIIDDLIP